MAMSKAEIQSIQQKAEAIRTLNITDFFTMLLTKATLWKARMI